MYRESWGCDVIGMTNMPEAKLAREAELCYASVAMITDYDSWHPDHGAVDVSDIIETLTGNADKARALVARLPALLGADRAPCPHGCDRALEYAILTAPDARDPAVVAKLDAVAGRVLGMSLDLWLAFVAASTALLLIPGPTVLLVLSYALSKGRSVAVASAAGVALGDLVAMTASLAGSGGAGAGLGHVVHGAEMGRGRSIWSGSG